MNTLIDIQENEIFELSPELLNTLLKDHTLSTDTEQVNIFWATDNYADRGKGYQYGDQIKIEAITGANGNVIVRWLRYSHLRGYATSRIILLIMPGLAAREFSIPKLTIPMVPIRGLLIQSRSFSRMVKLGVTMSMKTASKLLAARLHTL